MEKKPFPELGLAPDILQAVTALGFEQPSPIQAQAIPPALEGRDVVGQSQTGSGKTMAFAIPAVQMLDARERGVRVLIMCPTRELAMQVCESVHKLCMHKPGVKALPIYGGATYDRQIRGLRDGAQIVVGTPGRILDFVEKKILDLSELKMLVFDEADEMLDMGFRDDIDLLMKSVPETRQTLFFSATIDGPIRRLVESYTRNPAIITVEHKAMTVPTVEQRFYEVHFRSKVEVLCRLLDLENPRLAIVFANTKKAVDDATDALIGRGYAADRLHGDLNQIMRDRVMKNFRAGNVEVLIATDVAARGLDVDDIDLVVNLDLPYDEEDYVHRIGRTGRAGRSGKAVNLVSGREIFLLQRIQRYAKVKIERHNVPSREEVEGKRVDAQFEKLKATLDEGKYTKHEDTVQRLLDAGHSSTDIASALLHLLMSESGRESEEIMEDRPKFERRPREERPQRDFQQRTDYQERPPQRNFDNQGQGAAPYEERPRPPRFQGGQAEPGITRMFINLGAMDDAQPRDIAGLIYSTAQIPPGSLGKIEILEKCSFVGVPTEFAQQVETTVTGSTMRGRELRMNVAERQEFGDSRGGGFRRPPQGGGGGYGGGFRKPYGGGGGYGGNQGGGGGGGGGYGGGFKKPYGGGGGGFGGPPRPPREPRKFEGWED
jgi:ATP-dependent RNA helicase DeaD